MRNAVTLIGALALALSTSGCPTAFTGNAHVTDGKAGCERKCKQSGLRFSGMVFLGEYSSACVCEPKPAPSETAAPNVTSAPSSPPAPVAPAAPPEAPPPAALPPAPTTAPASPPAPTSGGARPASGATGAAVAVMLQQIRDDEHYQPITLVD